MSVREVSSVTSSAEVQKLESAKVQTAHIVADHLSHARKTTKRYQPQKPKLYQTPQRRMIALAQTMEVVQQQIADLNLECVEELIEKVATWTKDEMAKSSQMNETDHNGLFLRMLSGAGAAATFAVGLYLLRDQNISKWTSGGMVAAGVGSGFCMAANEIGVHPAITAILSLSLGVMGFSLGGAPNLASVTSHTTQLVMQSISLLQGIMQSMGQVRAAHSKYENAKIDLERMELRDSLRLTQTKLGEKLENATSTLESINPMHERMQQLLNEQNRLKNRIISSMAPAA